MVKDVSARFFEIFKSKKKIDKILKAALANDTNLSLTLLLSSDNFVQTDHLSWNIKDNMLFWLLIAEFAYNNSAYSFIEKFFFYLAYNQPPGIPDMIHAFTGVYISSTKAYTTHLINLLPQFGKRKNESCKYRVKYYNEKHL